MKSPQNIGFMRSEPQGYSARREMDWPKRAVPAKVVPPEHSMKNTLLRLLPILALALVPLRAADEPQLAALRAADDERVAATLAADRPRLAAIFADDLRYAHSSGAVDTKTTYIEALTSGRTKYVLWDYQERNFSFPAPGIALMTGRTRIKITKADGATEMLLSYLGVWREEKGQWRFVAWQSGKLPEPVPAGK